MRKMNFILTGMLFLCISVMSVAQSSKNAVDFGKAVKSKEIKESSRNSRVVLSRIISESNTYVPGATMDLVFKHIYESPDYEWTDGVSLEFPADVYVNSATNIQEGTQVLNYNGETGDGATVTWGDISGGSEYGDLHSDATFTVNVSIDENFTGIMEVDWYIAGDAYGAAPNFNQGTIEIIQAVSNDLAIINLEPRISTHGDEFIPSVTVQNNGTLTQDSFEINVIAYQDLTDSVVLYSSSIEINDANLEATTQETYQLTEEWENPEIGKYYLYAHVNLENEENEEDNEYISSIFILGNAEAIVINGVEEAFMGMTLPDGQFNNIASTSVENWPAAMEYADGEYYLLRSNPAQLFTFNPDNGQTSLIGNVTGTQYMATGLAYNWGTSTMYMMTVDTDNNPHLGTIDLETAAYTNIGQGNGMIIGIDFDNSGDLYGTCIADNTLYHININDGSTTAIGELGLNINFGQDISFDINSNIMYALMYGSVHGLYIIDLETGKADLIMPHSDQFACFAIKGEPSGPMLVETNPTNNAEDISIATEIYATFNVNITEVDFNGITINPEPGNMSISIDDNKLIITTDSLEYNTNYSAHIPAGAISDGNDELFADINWTFNTELDPDACNEVSNIEILDIDINSVLITWQENGPASNWKIQYGETGFEMGNGDMEDANDKPFNLTGLDANTEYDLYLKSVCGGGEASEWVGPVSFRTLCEIITQIPWTETFEDDSQTRECFTQIFEAEENEWTFGQGATDGNIVSAQQGLVNARYTDFGNNGITKLVTPWLQLNENNSYVLSFWYAQEDWAGDQNELKVYYRNQIDGNWIEIAHYTNNIMIWTNEIIGLPEPSATYQIAFEGHDYWGYSNVIDNISIEIGTEVIDNNISSNISIYPNPSSGIVNINTKENAHINILDISGRLLNSFTVNPEETININKPSGIYIIQINSDGEISNHRLVIQ